MASAKRTSRKPRAPRPRLGTAEELERDVMKLWDRINVNAEARAAAVAAANQFFKDACERRPRYKSDRDLAFAALLAQRADDFFAYVQGVWDREMDFMPGETRDVVGVIEKLRFPFCGMWQITFAIWQVPAGVDYDPDDENDLRFNDIGKSRRHELSGWEIVETYIE